MQILIAHEFFGHERDSSPALFLSKRRRTRKDHDCEDRDDRYRVG